MLFEKHLMGVRVDTLTAKMAISGVNPLLSLLASLLSTPWPSRQVQAIISELFHLKNKAPTAAGARADLCESSIPCKALSDELAASDIIELLTVAPNM
jgi:hypothetical protein